MRFVCVFEAVYVCVCAGQSKTSSIVKAFETLLLMYIIYIRYLLDYISVIINPKQHPT